MRKGEPFSDQKQTIAADEAGDEKQDAKFEKQYPDKLYDPSYLETIKEYDPSVFDSSQYD